MSDDSTRVEMYDAPPAHGNYTDEADMHIWCAESLAHTLSGEGREVFDSFNDSVRDGVLYLLTKEIQRARQALAAERKERTSTFKATASAQATRSTI